MLDRYLSAEGRFFPFYFIYLVVACALTFALRPIYRKVWRREPSVLTVGFVIVVGSIVAAYLWLILGELIFALLRLKSFPVPAKQSLLHYLTNTFVISLQHHKPFLFLSWSALYFGIKYWQTKKEKEENVLKAEALAREAELKMLRYQLNPHFLFNSLNSAGALIAENPQQAEKMINELSDFLRYSLVDSKGGAVPLKEEIEAVKNYLNIEKVRFEEKLEVKFSIAKPAEEFVVPNFLLHPLVENAVKYGMQTSQLPLQIEVQAERTNRKLLLAVVNSGTWQKESETSVNNNGMRVGLENVRQRLAQFFPSRHSMRTFERDGRVWVQLEMTE